MKTSGLRTSSTIALLAVLCFSSSAAAAPAGQDGPPQNRKQCQRFLKSVDAALVWENKRHRKAQAKLEARRDALQARATALTAVQAESKTRMDTLLAALEDQANPPGQEDADRMVAEYNSLATTFDENGRKLQTLTDELEGLEFEFSELKKLHVGNVKSTVKYRKQVATYCRKFNR